MSGTEVEFPVADGVLSGVDFGGHGEGVLLVHGSGHNSAAWMDVASHLAGHCHPVAFDLRGHGQTELSSSGAEQYWRDIGSVVTALSWDHPVLVGHSTGGYAVTAAAAAGLVEPAALCVVDGVVLDDRDTSLAEHAMVRSLEAADRLRNMFRYGWKASDGQMHARRGGVADGPTGRRTTCPRRQTGTEAVASPADDPVSKDHTHVAPAGSRKPGRCCEYPSIGHTAPLTS